jgi:LEA14-like dessication related protein
VLRFSFDRAEAAAIDRLTLYFTLELENPRPYSADVGLGTWNVKGPEGAEFQFSIPVTRAEANSTASFPARLEVILDQEAVKKAPADQFEYTAEITLELILGYDSGEEILLRSGGNAAFPLIREPVFTITSIAVKRAELINTRFVLGLRVDNPNPFPASLSAFSYELYGAGRLWADGTEDDVLDVPPLSSAERELSLVMNFINMKRDLLNQIIALRQVSYRFTGQALVVTGLDTLPQFPVKFEVSGNSPVLE